MRSSRKWETIPNTALGKWETIPNTALGNWETPPNTALGKWETPPNTALGKWETGGGGGGVSGQALTKQSGSIQGKEHSPPGGLTMTDLINDYE